MPRPTVPDAHWLYDNEPCRAACPVHTDAGAYVTAIAEGRYRDAYRIARAPNPFASICGRVCAAPCESACRRGTVDAPVAIRALKRFVTERFGVESFAASTVWHQAHGPVPQPTLGSVGIIGGGPAGLAAAYELRLAGHPVTVYEATDRLGGMMVLGIPEYRLARGIITREIDAIIELGIDVQLSCRVGHDVTVDDLLARHESLFLAVGTGVGRDLDLPGHDLDGVLRAVEFLLNVNRGFKMDLGTRVVVVGGGNVAFDAARTALRAAAAEPGMVPSEPVAGVDTPDDARRGMVTTLDVARAAVRAGVLDVTVIALESPEEIPADPEEIAEAESEGITILYRKGPHRFVGEAGRITGLETIDVKSVFDEARRFNPSFIPGTQQVLDADTVILAVGQTADLDAVAGLGLVSNRGGIRVDPGTLRTSHERVWAGGDVAHGPRNLIDAIADGQRAAAAIHHASDSSVATNGVRVELTRRGGYRRLSTGYDAIARQPIPTVTTDRRIGFAEVEAGYDEHEAWLESLRCLRCFDNVMLDPELCILCGLCVDVCPPNCITIARADTVGLGTASQSVLLLDEDLCIRCGLCVNRCPPGALSMVHAQEVVP
jgi:NADPH-dependent glutamate synthase beta subunit-like oxidoreductase/ferredoxin